MTKHRGTKGTLFLFTILATIFMVSCSGYEKLLKSKDYEYKYKKALEYYEKKEHYRYTTLLEQLSPIYKGTFRSDTIEYYIAQGYYYQGDYLLAGHSYDKFRQTFQRSAFTEDAEFMYAYCFYKSSPRPELDQASTQEAIEAFVEFLTRFPSTNRRTEVNGLLTELREKLVEKSYLSSKLYYKIGDYKAAIVAIQNSLKDFPNSKYREELSYLLVKSSYLLAENSIPNKQRERYQNTIDQYYTFVGEFPESPYLPEAKKMYESSMKVLQIN